LLPSFPTRRSSDLPLLSVVRVPDVPVRGLAAWRMLPALLLSVWHKLLAPWLAVWQAPQPEPAADVQRPCFAAFHEHCPGQLAAHRSRLQCFAALKFYVLQG